MKTIHIGMIGLGTVGSGVYRILTGQKDLLERRLGLGLHLKKIAVKNLKKKRDVRPPASLLTGHVEEILNDPEIDIVVEVMGGGDNPYPQRALQKGKHVVTANKALLATAGSSLFLQASKQGLFLGYEAAVAGGIPIIRAIEESFVGNRIEQIHGIINGTANYILSRMMEQGIPFNKALQEAQQKGYAEQDPRMDVEGTDSAQKLCLLVSLCFGVLPQLDQIGVEGITRLTPLDIAFADKLGYLIKLLAIAKDHGEGLIEARVHPTMIRKDHPLAKVGGVFNAILLHGDAVGETMFWGKGAGMLPTASAVVSDIAVIARCCADGLKAPLIHRSWSKPDYISMDDLKSDYYLRFSVVDKPGVMAQIAGVLGKNDISIASVYQHERDLGSEVPVVVMTHEAGERDIRKALRTIDQLPAVPNKTVLIRVER